VATYASSGGIFNKHFTANLPGNLHVKKICKSLKIRQNYGHEFVASLFGPPCHVNSIFEKYTLVCLQKLLKAVCSMKWA